MLATTIKTNLQPVIYLLVCLFVARFDLVSDHKMITDQQAANEDVGWRFPHLYMQHYNLR